jgi:tetratricopeptide (TPR) repeat protein
VVTFNGRGFDIPLLKTRHVMNGIPQPFDDLQHIDLLPVARKLWRNRLPSRALKSLEIDILGVPRSADDVPGYLIPEMYFEYLRSGDARPLSGIFYHNGMDILSLAALFIFVNDLLAAPLQLQSIDSLDLLAIARAHEDQGFIDQAIGLYERAIAQGLPRPFFTDTLHRFAQLNRRQGSWERALHLWMKSANEYQHIEACVELAKFYEHRQRNYEEALSWTQAALQFLSTSDRIPAKKIMLQKELERRIARLVKKIAQSPL